MKFIMACWVEVGFEASIHMNNVEMASSFARNFSVNDFRWRHVELVCWERLAQSGNVFGSEKDNEVDVVCESRLAVEDGGHVPADQIPHCDLFRSGLFVWQHKTNVRTEGHGGKLLVAAQPLKHFRSLPNNLHQYPLLPSSIELSVENLLPRPEVEFALRDGDHNFTPHHLAL